MVDILVDCLPEGVARASDEVVGRVPRERLLAHEPVRMERLAPPGETEGLSVLVPAGMRAVSLVLDGHDRVSGFLQFGNRVDIIVHTDAEDGGDTETRTVLEGVRVLALGRDPATGGRGKPQVVLQLTPDDAQTLTHAVEAGKVELVLRSDIDLALSDLARESATTRQLLGLPEQRIVVREWMSRASPSPTC